MLTIMFGLGEAGSKGVDGSDDLVSANSTLNASVTLEGCIAACIVRSMERKVDLVCEVEERVVEVDVEGANERASN